MSTIRDKRKASIVKNIKRIAEDIFEEDDIKALLIDIRENCPANSYTRELGDFIAHDERDKGIFHQELDFRALILKSRIPAFSGKFQINPLLLSKKIQYIIYNQGVNFVEETDLQIYTGLRSRKHAREFLNQVYTFEKKKQEYRLNDIRFVQQALTLISLCTSTLNAVPVTTSDEIITQFNRDVKSILNTHIEGYIYQDEILKNKDGIMLCIMSIFQDVKFKLYDGSEGSFVLTEDMQKHVKDTERKNLVLAGSFKVISPDKWFFVQTVFVESDLLISNYYEPFVNESQEVPMAPTTLKDVYVARNNSGRLILYGT